MGARRTILLTGASLLAAAIAIWWQLRPRITNEFSIGDLGEPSVGVQVLPAGLGMLTGQAISNAFVQHDAMRAGKADRFSAGGSNRPLSGKPEPWHAEFREGPWAPIKQRLFDRTLPQYSGGKPLHYSVDVLGAITHDGSQWLFVPRANGADPDKISSVLATCRFFPMSRGLRVTVTERIGTEEPRSYSVMFDVAFDGELQLRDR